MSDNKNKQQATSTKQQEPKDKPYQTNKSKSKEKDVKLSASLQKIIDQIEKLSVLELSELVKALEDKFGVSAAAPVVVAGGTPAAAGGETAAAEEKSSYTVVLAASGANKIAVIKALREVKPDLGLKDAKDLSDQAPKTVLENATKEQAQDAKTKLEAAGAQVELK